jgi:hypothetical protein
MILLVNASETRPQTDKILVILSAAKDLAERSDTGRAAGVRSFAALRATGKRPCSTQKSTCSMLFDDSVATVSLAQAQTLDGN